MNDLIQYLTTGTGEFVVGWDWVGDCVHGVGDWCWVHCVGWCCYNIDLNMFQFINIIILMNNMHVHYNSTDVDSHIILSQFFFNSNLHLTSQVE